MGTDLDQYVHPDRISSQLICPICTQVLKNPVQTSTDHLFCEDELLEWMTRSNLCPVSKQVLDPEKITKPSRIIMNMLAELEIYCSNKAEGCNWSGPHERLGSHLSSCTFRPRSELQAEILALTERVEELEKANEHLESRSDLLGEENSFLKGLVEEYQQRLRVFHALLPSESRPAFAFDGDDSVLDGGLDESVDMEDSKEDGSPFRRSSGTTVVERLRNLRTLQSLHVDEEESKKSAAAMDRYAKHPQRK